MAENSKDQPGRRKQGGRGRPFPKGQSGNPGGRPKAIAEVRELAREHTGGAIGTLAEIMNSKKAPPGARISAAAELLNRGWGRSEQAIFTNVQVDQPPRFTKEQADAMRDAAEKSCELNASVKLRRRLEAMGLSEDVIAQAIQLP